MPIEKPILAPPPVEDISKLKFPFLGTPKFDGIRCCIINKKAVTRKLIPIPNLFIRRQIEIVTLDDFDGEIMPKVNLFNKVQSAVMRESGEPEFKFMVFDWVQNPNEPYYMRVEKLSRCPLLPNIEYVIPVLIRNEEELLAYEIKCLNDGHEGVMLRSPNSIYKSGRSTLKQQYLLKIKRFDDSEAIILDTFEQMKNVNEAGLDRLGYTKRSSHQDGKIPNGTLGGFNVRDIKSGVEFRIGTGRGMDNKLRAEIWKDKDSYIGKILKYKSQKYGELNKPRMPVFIGFRDPRDM